MRNATSLVFAAAMAASSVAAGTAFSAEPEKAVFAGGCFWCMEEAFEKVPGVTAAVSGYIGGTVENPTYQQVSGGDTGHFEAVEVEYDPAQVTYEQLLEKFWHNVDPFDAHGQFCDKGSQYLSAIFFGSDEERQLAESTREKVAAQFSMPIATEILPEATFYPAEDYHQGFYQTNSARYQYYKFGCGRVQRLEEIWGKPAA